MNELGLTGKITVSNLKQLIEDTVLPPFEDAVDGLVEACEYAARLGVPTIVHHAAPTKDIVKELAYIGNLLVAAHSNHNSFDTEEAIEACKWLKERNVIIDILVPGS